MSTRHVPPSPAGTRRRSGLGVLAVAVAVLQVGCVAGTPRGAPPWGHRAQPLAPRVFEQTAPTRGEPPSSGSAGGVGAAVAPARPGAALARWPEEGESQEEARERARRVEGERVGALVLSARHEGRELEEAREAEADRTVAHVVGLASGEEEVGARLACTFWVEGGALTLVGYQEEAALWFAGGMAAKGLGFLGAEGLEWVSRALRREPEVAAGWLRTALKRLSGEEKKAFEQLWRKVALEGEQALTQSEREAMRGLFARLEKVIQQPLDRHLKGDLRQEARKYYAKLYPQFAEILDRRGGALPVHHRRQLEYAHLFPDEDINAGENLAMLQKYVHDEISFLWGRFRKARPNPTADEVRRAAEIIDRQFEPWYHRVSDPPGLLKTAEEAREAALRELRSRFPGLD